MNQGRPAAFFSLFVLLSLPFYLLGALAPQLSTIMPAHLPISALMFICPVLAAILLTRQDAGPPGVWRLLRRTFDGHVRFWPWLLVSCLVMPVITLLSYWIQLALGQPLPHVPFPWLTALVYVVIYFVAAAGEELGWTAYALEPLEARYGLLKAALLLGAFWGLWHVIPYVQMGRTPEWIVWGVLSTVAQRLTMVWLYHRSGRSVLSSILYHTMINVSYSVFPVAGSHYDPLVTGSLLLILGVMAASTLSRMARQ